MKSNDKVYAKYRCNKKQSDKNSDQSDRNIPSTGYVVDPAKQICLLCEKPLLNSEADKQKAQDATVKFEGIYNKDYRRFFDGRAICMSPTKMKS
jgi:hypothetical protein